MYTVRLSGSTKHGPLFTSGLPWVVVVGVGVGQSTSPPLYLWFTVGGSGLGFSWGIGCIGL